MKKMQEAVPDIALIDCKHAAEWGRDNAMAAHGVLCRSCTGLVHVRRRRKYYQDDSRRRVGCMLKDSTLHELGIIPGRNYGERVFLFEFRQPCPWPTI